MVADRCMVMMVMVLLPVLPVVAALLLFLSWQRLGARDKRISLVLGCSVRGRSASYQRDGTVVVVMVLVVLLALVIRCYKPMATGLARQQGLLFSPRPAPAGAAVPCTRDARSHRTG